MRIFDFKCSECGSIREELVDPQVVLLPCSSCDYMATKIISVPMIKISGTDPDFPTAWNSWEKKRNQRMKQEAKQDN